MTERSQWKQMVMDEIKYIVVDIQIGMDEVTIPHITPWAEKPYLLPN